MIFSMLGVVALGFSLMSFYTPSEDCTGFYDEEGNLIYCPDGLWFNPTLEVCDWPSESGCEVGLGLRRLLRVSCICPNGDKGETLVCRANGDLEKCGNGVGNSKACYGKKFTTSGYTAVMLCEGMNYN